MCVILVCEESRPSKEMVGRAWGHNSDGGGVAWIEGKGTKAEVHWKKGLDEEEMQDFCKTLPLPFIAHFRVASSGSKHFSLCHPFPCTKGVENTLEGKLKGAVMFHNGTWQNWKEYGLKTSLNANIEVPRGLWNDTRTMAWMAGVYGVNVLEFINEKAAIITPQGGTEIFGDGWSVEGGIYLSNRHFLHSGRGWVQHGGNSGQNSTIDIKVTDRRHTAEQQNASPGGVLASDVPFRGSNQTLLQGGDVEESVQEGTEGVSTGDGKSESEHEATLTDIRVTTLNSAVTQLPLERARERLQQRETSSMVVLGPSAPDRSGLWRTPQEAVAEARKEREHRLEAARKGIIFLGEM